MLRQWHDTGRCDRWHQLRQRWLQACHQFIHGVVADSNKFNRLVSPSLARNPYLESSFNNCSGPLHLLFCSSTLQMPQQVTVLVLPPYIPGRVIDNFYPLKLHYHPSTCNERFLLGNAMAMLFLTRKTWHPVPSLPTDTSNVVVRRFHATPRITSILRFPAYEYV